MWVNYTGRFEKNTPTQKFWYLKTREYFSTKFSLFNLAESCLQVYPSILHVLVAWRNDATSTSTSKIDFRQSTDQCTVCMTLHKFQHWHSSVTSNSAGNHSRAPSTCDIFCKVFCCFTAFKCRHRHKPLGNLNSGRRQWAKLIRSASLQRVFDAAIAKLLWRHCFSLLL